MRDTQEVWQLFKDNKYEVFLSDIVAYEISKCSSVKMQVLQDYMRQIEYHVIETGDDVVELAEKFIDFGVLKRKSYDDCRHIAAAIFEAMKKAT